MKKICVLPFMHTLIQPDGNIKLCCNSKNEEQMPNVSDVSIKNILNNPHHIKIRQEMMQGKQPDACSQCWKNESLGIESYRQQQFYTYPHYLLRVLNTKDGVINAGVKYLDVRFNNTCNLKCVMCSSEYSTAWIDDERKLLESGNQELRNIMNYRVEHYDKESYKWSKDRSIFNSIVENSIALERLHFAGGEPLLSKLHVPLLKELIVNGTSKKLYLSYNTNGEFIDQELLDLWANFKRVKIFYSLDQIQEKNEYIRYPSKWGKNLETFDLIETSSPKNVEWKLLSTIGALNIFYIPEFVDWKLSMNFKKIHNDWLDGGIGYAKPIYFPTYLNAGVLPFEFKQAVATRLRSYTTQLPKRYHKEYKKIIKENIDFMYNEDNSKELPVLKSYLTNLDKIRGTDFKKTFPDLPL